MSPPSQKSAGGASAKSSSKGASSKGGARKSAPKKDAAKKDAKAAPKKKRTRKKKKTGKGKALLVAFAAGLLVSAAAAWFLRDLRLPEIHFPESAQVQRAEPEKAPPVAQAPAKSRDTASKNAKAGPKQQAEPKAAERAQDAAKARPAKAAPAPQKGGEPTAPVKGAERPARTQPAEGTASAVASALIDLQSLPYEESLHASLDESIRQADYALMQAAWIRKLPASSMRLASVEDRLEGVEPYQFQVIDILPGKSARDFTAVFKECLAAWAEDASLVESGLESGVSVWAVTIKGVHTHSVRLYPGKSVFPPLPGKERPEERAAPQPERKTHMAPPRVRAGHEAPKLVIVIDDLGASHSALKQLLALDFPITAAFWPHGAHTKEGARLAHNKGREVIVHQPMEPLGYPKVQPGPNVLLVGMNEARIRKVLLESIAAVPHAVGLNNHMGSRFTQNREGVDAVIRLLKERGLFMLDSVTHSRSVFAAEGRRFGLTHYRRNVFLDVEHSKKGVLEALRRAERIALLSGQAVAIGHPLPETIAGLKEWQRLRDKRVRIVTLRELLQE